VTTQEYRTNRSQFPRQELEPYRGQWLAFSADGRRVVAHAEGLERLEEQLAALGEDPQRVVFEHVPGPDDGPDLDPVEFLMPGDVPSCQITAPVA
jgi:hypothetical protein